MTDLEQHGYGDILFPQEFVTKSDEYKASVPKYLDGELRQATFDVNCRDYVYNFGLYAFDKSQQSFDYKDMDNVQTIVIDDINLYLFEFDDGYCVVEFVCDEYRYYIQARVSYSEIVEIAKTLKRG